MKAAVSRAAGAPMTIEELTLGPAGPGEIKVRVHACAICMSDVHFIDGGWQMPLPAVFGHEAAGVVQEVGEGVSDVAPGDHVLVTLLRACAHCRPCETSAPWLCTEGHRLDAGEHMLTGAGEAVRPGLRTGAFAEEAMVDRSQVARIPADMPMTSAALLSCGVVTGWGAVARTAAMPAGADSVVIGVGGVGLNCVQACAAIGARRTVAVDLSDEKLAAARAFGATDAINPRERDTVAAVKELTGGRGAEFVFVAAGARAAIEQGLEMLSTGGALTLVGMPAEDFALAAHPLDMAGSGKRILGSKMGSTDLARDLPEMVEMWRDGRLKLEALVSNVFPLERINEAVAETRAGRGLRNVVTVI